MNGIAPINERVPDRANAGHDKFIPTNAEPNDWASQSSTQETGLWGGKYTDYEWHAPLTDETNVNNPCPEGYRVPTVNEFLSMAGAILNTTLSYNKKYSISDPNTVFAESDLHLPSSGDMLYSSSRQIRKMEICEVFIGRIPLLRKKAITTIMRIACFL